MVSAGGMPHFGGAGGGGALVGRGAGLCQPEPGGVVNGGAWTRVGWRRGRVSFICCDMRACLMMVHLNSDVSLE